MQWFGGKSPEEKNVPKGWKRVPSNSRPGEFSPLEKVDLSAITRQHDFNYKVTHNNEFVYIPQSCTMGCLGEH